MQSCNVFSVPLVAMAMVTSYLWLAACTPSSTGVVGTQTQTTRTVSAGGGVGGTSTVVIGGIAVAASQGQGGDTGGSASSGSTQVSCDDAGNCGPCLAILSLGQPGAYGSASGDNGNTNEFQTYMNTNTNGKMTMMTTFTSLTDALLGQYNIIILQALEDRTPSSQSNSVWTFQQSDIDALEKWVKAGGAIIAMSGYGLNSDEVKPTNQLLSFSGISYGTGDTFTTCPDNLCQCCNGSIPFSSWQSSYTDNPAITHDLKEVGIYSGRPLSCTGSDCQVWATDPSTGGADVGVAQVVGQGRILAWGDEWVTYTSQWGLTATPYDNATNYPQCVGRTAQSVYNVPQFWNNVFKWVAPTATCFTITQPSTPGQQIVF